MSAKNMTYKNNPNYRLNPHTHRYERIASGAQPSLSKESRDISLTSDVESIEQRAEKAAQDTLPYLDSLWIELEKRDYGYDKFDENELGDTIDYEGRKSAYLTSLEKYITEDGGLVDEFYEDAYESIENTGAISDEIGSQDYFMRKIDYYADNEAVEDAAQY